MYRLDTRESAKKTLTALMGLGVFLTLVALAVGPLSAQEAREQAGPSPNVATYDIQAAFEQHPVQEELKQALDSLQAEAREAQQEGGAANIQALEQQFEQKRTQLVAQFHDDVNKAIPGVAKAVQADVVALEVAWSADNVEVVDITREIIAEFKKEAGDQGGTPDDMPVFPPLQED